MNEDKTTRLTPIIAWMTALVPRWVVVIMMTWMAGITMIYGNALLNEVGENCHERVEMENTTVRVIGEIFDYLDHLDPASRSEQLREMTLFLEEEHPISDPGDKCP